MIASWWSAVAMLTRLPTGSASGDRMSGAWVAGRIVSSPTRRARQTARAIARAVPGLRVEVDERWSEADIGIAEGLTFDELASVEPDLAERLGRGEADIDWLGGESASSLTERVRSALRDLRDEPTRDRRRVTCRSAADRHRAGHEPTD